MHKACNKEIDSSNNNNNDNNNNSNCNHKNNNGNRKIEKISRFSKGIKKYLEETSESLPYHNWGLSNNFQTVKIEAGEHWHRNKGIGIAEECHLMFCKDSQERSQDLRRLDVTEPKEKRSDMDSMRYDDNNNDNKNNVNNNINNNIYFQIFKLTIPFNKHPS